MTTFRKLVIAGCASAMTIGFAPAVNAQAGTAYIGQVSAFGGNFCPRGWTPANGQLLPIAQYTALFSLYGTIYGGDGRTTFQLPDLRGRRPVSEGTGTGLGSYRLGSRGGATSFTITAAQLPSHNHTGTTRASSALGNSANPRNNVLAVDNDGVKIYHNGGSTNNMAAGSLAINNAGGGQSVNKVSPFQVVQWCVALDGVYPSRS
ncbi:phage tail protein [Erythrobacter sp. THAF29]|uniref:phage tail protein n=1 Tax=Erythrobacter sp. THAF29 TaxID=2587851 RepID=UPI0012A84223|nr:tail fiber protein [Erythrobacter sp. THAF29]QFT78499.1 Phage Tail Collar Domain protein [Erythrobacter sp. THAF29]